MLRSVRKSRFSWSKQNWIRLDFPDEFVPNRPVICPNEISADFQDLKFSSFKRENMCQK